MVSSVRRGIWLRHKSNEQRREGLQRARYTTYEISFAEIFFFHAIVASRKK